MIMIAYNHNHKKIEILISRRFHSFVIPQGPLTSARSSKQMSAPASPIMAYARSAPGAPSRMRGQAFDYEAFSPLGKPDFFEQGFIAPYAPARSGGIPFDRSTLSPIRIPECLRRDPVAPGAPGREQSEREPNLEELTPCQYGVKRKLFPVNDDGYKTPPSKAARASPPSLPSRY